MSKNRTLGQKGEEIALEFLQSQGIEIIAQNWTTGHKEIDIICRQQDIYIFVEVKTRKHSRMGMPEESINLKKIEAVTEAARIFLYDKNYKDIRFDVISILLSDPEKPEILHIKDAFY